MQATTSSITSWLAKVPTPVWALLAGFAALAGFAPASTWWLGLAGYGGLFLLWQHATARSAALIGLLFGFAHFGLGVSWVHISINRFGGAPLPLAILLAALLVLYCSLFVAASGWLTRKFFSGWWAAPTLFMSFDWLRGVLFSGFPWLSPGYGLVDSPFASIAAWVGVYGMGLVGLLVTALVLVMFDRARDTARIAMPLTAAVILLSLPIMGGTFTALNGDALNVAVLQGSVTQDKKWLPEQFQPTLELYRDLSLQHQNADLVVWPEVAIPGWYRDVESRFLEPLARELKPELVVGVLRQSEEQGRYYNAAIQISGNEYYKRHLVPFGEYAPFDESIGGFVRKQLGIPLPDFKRGAEQQAPMQVDGRPFVITLCYENAFGHEFRQQVASGSFIVNMSNDGWFGDSIALQQHLQMARLRALESQRWLLRATNTGVTSAISPKGEVVQQLPVLQPGSLQQRIQPRVGATPYLESGDRPFQFSIVLLSVLGLLLHSRKSLT